MTSKIRKTQRYLFTSEFHICRIKVIPNIIQIAVAYNVKILGPIGLKKSGQRKKMNYNRFTVEVIATEP